MSLLDEAIKVIEKVRDLHLTIKTNKKNIKVIGFSNKIEDVSHFEERLILLQEELENFDSVSGENLQSLNLKPTSKTIKEHGDLEGTEFIYRNASQDDSELELDLPINKKILTDRRKDFKNNKILEIDFPYSFEDSVNDSSDTLLAEDSLQDKLLFAINKVGWTPKTRNLALALKRLEDKIGALDRQQKIDLGVEWQLILESSLEHIYSENQSPIRNLDLDLEENLSKTNFPKPKPNLDY